jgi:predicted RNA binding protein YcfA (HicA-like mRNA interferase family)
VSGKELVKVLQKSGWTINRISGSHFIMVKEGKRSVPVPVHGNKDMPKGTLSAIMKQTGLKDCERD